MSHTPLALWAEGLCRAPHCPGPEGCSCPSRSGTRCRAPGPPRRSKAVLMWAQPHAAGLALSLCHGVHEAPGVAPARLSQVCLLSVGTSQPAFKLPSS